jgi:hypothetical protein
MTAVMLANTHRRFLLTCLLACLALMLGAAVPTAHARARGHAAKTRSGCARTASTKRARRPRASCASARRTAAGGRKSSAKYLDSGTRSAKKLPPGKQPPPSPPPPTAGQGLHVGVTVESQGFGDSTGDRQDQALAMNATWSREEFDWSVIEPSPGVWNWTRYDRLFTEAAPRHLSIVANALESPSWAGSSWNALPSDASTYADFVARIAARYGPGGTFWTSHPALPAVPLNWIELWNEPYCVCFSAGGADPARYAGLVKTSVRAGRAANPNVKYLIESDSTGSNGHPWFLSGMYAAVPDLNQYFEGVAVHPYSYDTSPSVSSTSYGFQQGLVDVRNTLVAHGATDKPLWITELGWPTCPAGAAERCVSEAQQAAYVKTAFDLVKTTYSSYVRALFIYHYGDFAPGNPSDREQWFGLSHVDGTHKPAYDVFRAEAAGSSRAPTRPSRRRRRRADGAPSS